MVEENVERPVAMVALMRGINVGGNNLLPMKEASRIFTDAGCENVSTYIQSGNVLFRARTSHASGLPERIARDIEQRFGFRVPIVLRTASELAETVAYNPFLSTGVNEANLHVYFLAHHPTAEQAASLEPDRSPPDVFLLRGRDIYLSMPNGMGRTKLTNAYFDRKLSTVATARNWRTTLKLLELMQAL